MEDGWRERGGDLGFLPSFLLFFSARVELILGLMPELTPPFHPFPWASAPDVDGH